MSNNEGRWNRGKKNCTGSIPADPEPLYASSLSSVVHTGMAGIYPAVIHFVPPDP